MRGFTIVELMIVIIIIGILATIAIPTYSRSVERSRQAEAISILGAMRGAQLRWAAENNGAFTTDPANLDIDLPPDSDGDGNPDGRFFEYDLPGVANNLAQATRNGIQQTAGSTSPPYALIIQEDGTFTCFVGECAGFP